MANKKNKLEKRIFILDRKALPKITEDIQNTLKKSAEEEGINLYIKFVKRIEILPEDYDAYFIHHSDIRDLEPILIGKKRETMSDGSLFKISPYVDKLLEELKRIKQNNPKCKIYMISRMMSQVPDNLKLYVDRFIPPLQFYSPEDPFSYRKQIIISFKKNEPK